MFDGQLVAVKGTDQQNFKFNKEAEPGEKNRAPIPFKSDLVTQATLNNDDQPDSKGDF